MDEQNFARFSIFNESLSLKKNYLIKILKIIFFINNFSFFFFFILEAHSINGGKLFFFFFFFGSKNTNYEAQVEVDGYIRAASLIPACHSPPQKEGGGEGDCSPEWKYAL